MDENKFAELSAMLATKNHQIQRALQVLQKEACSQGEWIAIDDVVKAIRILQERQR